MDLGRQRVAGSTCIAAARQCHRITRIEPDVDRRLARAEALLGPNLETKVLNVFVTPHWLNGKEEFWYRREWSDGADFVRVDAVSGRELFVEHALEAALERVSMAC